jgi:large subunit ribosomal protein L24
MLIRKDDLVEVITGTDRSRFVKGKKEQVIRRVLRVLPEENKVVVEGVNRVYKHMKATRRNVQGGRLSKEMPIDVSNVQLYCSTCRRGVRVGKKYLDDGSKARICRKCKNELPPRLSKPRKAYAQK